MSKFDKLYKAIESGKTLLGVGPMSWNCVDATIEVANEHDIPMSIICSRRQVECEQMGGGYVATTESLAKYIKEKDKKENIFLARDHGGPFQGNHAGRVDHTELEHDKEMVDAMISYNYDIKSGFDILHLDPSLADGTLDNIIEDIEILYKGCENIAKAHNREIIYEAGTEEHSGQISDLQDFNYFVKMIRRYERDGLEGRFPKIKFVVGNMGNWVKEMENVGKFDEEKAKELVSTCNSNGFYLKGHNTDYVGCETLAKHPKLGIHSANIAPEYGVAETEELLFLLEFHRMDKLRKEFLEIAVKSGKWKKWMKPSSDTPTEVPDLYKAKICGHYVFSDPAVLEIKEKLRKKCPNLDFLLKTAVKKIIKAHLTELRWELT